MMDEEKRLTRKKNILLSVVSVAIICILSVSALLGAYY